MSQLSAAAQAKMNNLIALTAEKYGGVVGQQYAATPTVAQSLNDKIVEDGNPFLQRINTVAVDELKGEKVYLGLSGPISSRTETSDTVERIPKDLVALDSDQYELFPVESDVALRYATIDVWAKFPDFPVRYGQHIVRQIGNDRLTCGWYGVKADKTTDRLANPLMQDLNVGWLHQIEQWNAGSQVRDGTVQPIELGSAAHPNLDTIIVDGVDILDEPFRSNSDLVALTARNIETAALRQFYAQWGGRPTEKQQITDKIVTGIFGELPVIVPPFFPPNTILITPLSNLSIYWQSGSWRRQQKDKPEKNRYEDFNSRNEGYVVEKFENCVLLKNITIAP